MRDRELSSLADRFGIGLSALCVAHCLLIPVIFLVLPSLHFLGEGEVHDWFHHILLLVLPCLAMTAFVSGYRRHRHRRVFVWSSLGIVMVAAAALLFEHTDAMAIALSVSGGLFLIQAHLINRRLCACCRDFKDF